MFLCLFVFGYQLFFKFKRGNSNVITTVVLVLLIMTMSTATLEESRSKVKAILLLAVSLMHTCTNTSQVARKSAEFAPGRTYDNRSEFSKKIV